jgi:PAS domain-containing protein
MRIEWRWSTPDCRWKKFGQRIFVLVFSTPRMFRDFATSGRERSAALSRSKTSNGLLGKDGRYRWFLIRYNPLLDEGGKVTWCATGTDIEDRKQAENKLRHDERELRQLIDFLPQHVLVLDTEGSLLHANQMMLDYNGHTLKEMQGVGTDECRPKC